MTQKTPISLMNELAKGNDLNPEYKVIEESGPAHKKTFRVQLNLGDIGEWEGIANCIKMAKHAAAAKGLENCGLCLTEKQPKKQVNLTPTVELNGLAMKLGKATQYRDHSSKPLSPHSQGSGIYQGHMNGFQGVHNMQGYNRYPMHHQQQFHNQYNPQNLFQRSAARIIRVSLTVGDQEFIGEGRDKQRARHDAAQKAMRVLRVELLAVMAAEASKANTEEDVPEEEKVLNGVESTKVKEDEDENDPKSEISLVYEIATRRKLMVDFQDIDNVGPAHMKKFRVRATVGQLETEGEGHRKKDAKKDAAIKILEELGKLPESPEADLKKKKSGQYSRRGPHGLKRVKPKTDIDPTLNAISILGQILQRRNEPAPVYSLVEERGHLMNKEFVLKVTVGSHEATGVGSNKKTAKKNAGEAMLQLLGFRPTPAEKSAQKANHGPGTVVTTTNSNTSCNSPLTILGRQLKPGLLPMVPEVAKQLGCSINAVLAPIVQMKEEKPEMLPQGGLNRAPGAPIGNLINSTGKPLTRVQKLLQWAEVEGFRVQFTDYPKDNQGTPEWLSVVNVSSVPPLTCYGTGVSIEVANEEAAGNALKPLTTLEVDHKALSNEPAKSVKMTIKNEPIDSTAE